MLKQTMQSLPLNLDLIVLTYNEEANLAHCLKSVCGMVRNIFVVDSGSTDRTVEIAREFGAQIFTHAFTNQAEQFNWALENLPIQSDWVLRLDADEYLSNELRDELAAVLPTLPDEITGLYLKRRMIFLGRWIRYGGYYPTWLLRVFRRGKAQSELAEMDEHIVLLEGSARRLTHDFSDHNRKGLSAWLLKHEAYASRQVRVLLRGQKEQETGGVEPKF
ncbi:MAG TPA: glycosyltransferase family 2 protein, partial [Blastocatellia bacterium]|nr:glycosyltransferase family 2 protein [Blastocatellia bacterium]